MFCISFPTEECSRQIYIDNIKLVKYTNSLRGTILEMNLMYCVYFSILKVQILVDPVDLFQITRFHYIIWNSCNSYQNHCILSVLYWVPRVWSFSVLTIDSVNTSCIQISQYLFFWFWGHYSFPICIWSFTVISKSRRAFGKKCQTWT